MNDKMEKIIAKDLGISVENIRNSSWELLESRKRKVGERAFRNRDMFPVGGNINLSLGREMGMSRISANEIKRRISYRIKCLLTNRRHV